VKTIVFRLAFSFSLLIFGTFLPLFKIGPIREVVNLLWGFIFGFGWYMAGYVANLSSPIVVIFGALVWPIIVFILLYVWAGKILQYEPRPRMLCLIILVLSMFIDVPVHSTSVFPLRYIPLYINIYGAVY
jgi:hypothetical protein